MLPHCAAATTQAGGGDCDGCAAAAGDAVVPVGLGCGGPGGPVGGGCALVGAAVGVSVTDGVADAVADGEVVGVVGVTDGGGLLGVGLRS